ncbi:MAG: hypothetical protein KIT69_00885 [Propionibacteriaceae bacterium]|nr:hypothetical protein [Propionibacteriaceae bacterium]
MVIDDADPALDHDDLLSSRTALAASALTGVAISSTRFTRGNRATCPRRIRARPKGTPNLANSALEWSIGVVKALPERVSPRVFRVVGLPAPTDREKSQMYVQRYIPHLPAGFQQAETTGISPT